MDLPSQYKWLTKESAPTMLVKGLELYGTTETAGNVNNPVILSWAAECGLPSYNADSIPWCGLFIAVVAKRCFKKIPANALWARSWLAFGDMCDPELGCVLVFSREGGGGHVGLYVGQDSDCYHVLGGNQGDKVSITRIKKDRLIGSRAEYVSKPLSVRKVILAASGQVSTNEA